MSEQKKRSNVTPILVIVVIILVSAIIWAAKRPKSAEQTARTREPSIGQPHVHSYDTHTENPTETTVSDDYDDGQKLSMEAVIKNAYGWEPAYSRWYGKEAPDFTLTDINGKTHKLSDYRGKNVILVFWATWCGPCIMEIPHLIALRNVVSEDELAILAISYEEKSDVRKLVKSRKINYTVLMENGNMPSPFGVMRIYQTSGIPCSFFIDKMGNIKLATTGMISLGETKAILRAEWK